MLFLCGSALIVVSLLVLNLITGAGIKHERDLYALSAVCIIYRPHDWALWQIAGPRTRLRVSLVRYQPETKPRVDILQVTPETEAKGLQSATEPNHKVYIRYILCFATIAAILCVRSINLVVCAWQKGQITWISDLWLVEGHAIILIDLVAPLIYVTSIVYIRFIALWLPLKYGFNGK